MKKLFITLFGLSLIWCLMCYIRYGGIYKENIQTEMWYSLVEELEFPNLFTTYKEIFNSFKNNFNEAGKYITYSFKVLGDSSSLLDLLKGIWRVAMSFYNLFTTPFVFLWNAFVSLCSWLYYTLMSFLSILLFVFAPLFNYDIV